MSQILIQPEEQLSAAQILRTHGKQFHQIRGMLSDGHNGRCALGVILDYVGGPSDKTGWNIDDHCKKTSLYHKIKNALGEHNMSSVIEMNDHGNTFDEIADWLDSESESKANR